MMIKKVAKSRRISVSKKPSVDLGASSQTIPLLLYRRIALLFIVLVAAALIAVLYLATMQAVVHVSAVPKEIKTNFIVRTVETATTDGEVQGEIHTGTLGKTKPFTPSGGSQKEIEEQASGRVTLSSTMSSSQPLVATTRLLSKEGVLFRLRRGVTVPAGGSVEADVYADQKGVSGNIGPTTFSIPGLNEVKQKLVTAASSQPITGGVKKISVLSQEEIDEAVAALKSELLEDAKGMLRAERQKAYTGEAFFVDVKSQKVGARAGDEVGSFDVEMQVAVSGVFYDDEALKKTTLRKLYEGLGDGQEFLDTGESRRVVTVSQVNLTQRAASIHVSQTGKAVVSRASEALDVGRFVGMSEEDVETLLVGEGVATNVNVDFFPFWVRTVPRLKDHIYVEIQ
jgi:hypothetical protein